MLVKPEIPVLLSPKSALILNATIWDDAAGLKLDAKPHQIVVIEPLTAKTLVGSGLTMSRRAQLENLSQDAALSIDRWMTSMMVKNHWFGGVLTGGGRRKSRVVLNKSVARADGGILSQAVGMALTLSN